MAATPGKARVAAIDFGTGFCSLAYTMKEDDNISNVPLSFAYGPDSARVPTAVLLRKNEDGTLKVTKFGSPAQSEFPKLSSEAIRKYLYFECLKMDLSQESKVNREMKIQSFEGEKYYLVEVIAFVLLHLKNLLMGHLSNSGIYNPSPFEFDWVITVPAIWKARGKQMMREAATLAGLLSDELPEIDRLTPSSSPIKCPKGINHHKLTLALEPECAAMYCQQISNDQFASYSEKRDSPIADSYMVCDVGAGTVDITAYIKHGDDDIEVIIPPTGNDSGGREVNQQFYNFLQQVVNDDDFSSFRSKKKTNQAVLTAIKFHDIEKEKRQFGMESEPMDQDDDVLRLKLRTKFVDFYSQKRIADGIKDSRVSFDEEMNTLEIKSSKVREFFDPVVSRAIRCITDALMHKEIKGRIKMICLVGGFGGCKYFCNALKKAIPYGIHVVVPKQHTLAVSRGAIYYRRNPTVIKTRVMEASYGISSNFLFDKKVHDEAYAYQDPDTGVKKCKNLFSVFVKKGQKVSLNDPVVKIVLPYSKAAVKVIIPFYSTTDLRLRYTETPQGRDIAEKIGRLKIDCPNPEKLDKKDRKIEVTMDFSSTEIRVQVRALYLPDQPTVKAVLDFLTKHDWTSPT